MAMSTPTMFVSVLCLAFLVQVSGMVHHKMNHGTGGNEEYVIQLFINGLNPSWKVNSNNQNKTITDILKVLKQYAVELTSELPDHLVYRGYKIKHSEGHMSHMWGLPRCKKPDLEIAILQYTAGSTYASQYLNTLKESVQSCPKQGK